MKHLLLLCILTLFTSGARSADPPKLEAAPETIALLKKMATYYSGVKACRFTLQLNSTYTAGEAQQTSRLNYLIALHRPNRFRIEMMMDDATATVISDGSNLYRYLPAQGSYTIDPAEPELNIASMFAGDNSGIASFLAALFSEKPYDTLMNGVTKAELVGEDTVGGIECDRIRCDQQYFSWDIWIARGDIPYVKQIVPDMSHMMKRAAEKDPSLKDASMSILGRFDLWKASDDLAPNTFKFEPPPLSKRVESFTAPSPGQKAPEDTPSEPAASSDP